MNLVWKALNLWINSMKPFSFSTSLFFLLFPSFSAPHMERGGGRRFLPLFWTLIMGVEGGGGGKAFAAAANGAAIYCIFHKHCAFEMTLRYFSFLTSFVLICAFSSICLWHFGNTAGAERGGHLRSCTVVEVPYSMDAAGKKLWAMTSFSMTDVGENLVVITSKLFRDVRWPLEAG